MLQVVLLIWAVIVVIIALSGNAASDILNPYWKAICPAGIPGPILTVNVRPDVSKTSRPMIIFSDGTWTLMLRAEFEVELAPKD
jgi:hypothetical protein